LQFGNFIPPGPLFEVVGKLNRQKQQGLLHKLRKIKSEESYPSITVINAREQWRDKMA